MAEKTSNILAYVEPDIKEQADDEFDAMMEEGLAQARAGQGIPLDVCFRQLRGSDWAEE